MIEEYKGIISKNIIGSYREALVIDVLTDKLYRYTINNGELIYCNELSYMDYLNNCPNFIYENDIDNYVEALSISKLESNSGHLSLTYKRLDNITNDYKDSRLIVNLINNHNKKIIIVLDAQVHNSTSYVKHDEINNRLESKLKKIIDAVSLAILKIHNIINNDSYGGNKKEYINSIISSITTEFPEFNESLSENARFLTENDKSTIMIIDDDKMTCNLIKKIFDKDYDIVIANNGEEAINLLKGNEGNTIYRNNISCIFLDLVMPVLDGFSVLDYLNDFNYLSKLPVIIISGNYDKSIRNKAYSYKIADMLEKPFNVQVVRHRIENLINLYRSSNSLNEFLSYQHRDLKNIVNSLIVSYEIDNEKCINILKKYTRILTMQVAADYPEYSISSNMIDKIANSSMYYAIGNYTMPKSLMYKKSQFTEEERSIFKMSNINGANIIKYVLSKNNQDIEATYCYEIAKYHNERYDGNGYPEGISGNSIPLSAQIASLAIEYNNLINNITPVDYERVANLIIMESGRKYNPKIVESFKKVKNDFESITKVGI